VTLGSAGAYLVFEIAAPMSPWEREPLGLGGDLASTLVAFEAFGWLPDTESELHAARASVPATSIRIPEPRRRLRCLPCIVTPPAFQGTFEDSTVPPKWGDYLTSAV
jgi:hypothetical protein